MSPKKLKNGQGRAGLLERAGCRVPFMGLGHFLGKALAMLLVPEAQWSQVFYLSLFPLLLATWSQWENLVPLLGWLCRDITTALERHL